MRKRILSTLLTLCMVAGLLPAEALAAEGDVPSAENQPYFADEWSSEDKLAEFDGETEDAGISAQAGSATYIAYPVTGGSIRFEASSGTITDCDQSVTAVVIPSTINGVAVTSIGREAFQGCRGLTSITIPNNITNIGYHAFEYCSGLTSAGPIGSGCDYQFGWTDKIPGYAFYGCSGLNSVTIPDGITDIGFCAFLACYSLSSVTIPDSITSIGYHAFLNCSGLSSITIPDGVTRIGEGAFGGCSLSSITIPDGITSIRMSTFSGCNSLSSITIPDSVTTIENYAFYGCSSLSNITIPDSIISIGDYAFQSCSRLTGIMIPAGITCIGRGTFQGCHGLINITIPAGVTSIGNEAFSGCSGLTSVIIPDSITDIGGYAFDGCNSLTDVYYSGTETQWSAITDMGGNAPLLNATIHYNSTGPGMGGAGETLENKTVSGVLRSGDGCRVLWQCSYQVGEDNQPRNGDIRIFTSSTDTVEEELYLYNESTETGLPFPWELEPYNIPKSAIKSISINGEPKKLLRVSPNAFQNYDGLEQVTLNSVSTIDTSAFSGCVSLQNAAVSSSVKHIGSHAFQNTDLRDLRLGETVETISVDAFSGCANLKIQCYQDSVAHRYAVENNIPFELINPIDTSRVTVPFWAGDKIIEMDIAWNPNRLFYGNPASYNNDLAVAGLVMSWAAEDGQGRMEEIFTELGFNESTYRHFNYNFGAINPAVSFAAQDIVIGGRQKTLVACVVRGTTDISDFLVDLQSMNDGFRTVGAGTTVLLKGYLMQYQQDNDVILFITGHSLGGAVTGIVAENMEKELRPGSVFAYAFAPPYNSEFFGFGGGNHTSAVQNVINSGDWIPTLPPTYASRIGRYGYVSSSGAKIHQNPDHVVFTDSFKRSYKNLSGKAPDAHRSWNDHLVDTYMALLLSNESLLITTVYNYRLVKVLCPVDIEVLDSSNAIVGRTENNVVDNAVNSDNVYIFVQNDEKYIYLFDDDEYSFRMTGTGNGTLNYSVEDIAVDGSVLSKKNYSNVMLTSGKKLASNVGGLTDTPDVRLLVLGDDGTPEKEVLPDGNGTEVPITDPGRPTVPVNPDNMPPHSTGGYSSGGNTNTGYAITISSGITGGTVTVSPKSAAKGVTVTITTSPNEGYELDRLTVADASGNELELTEIGNGIYAFTMPGSRVTVDAVFTVVSPEKPEPPATPSIRASFTDVQPSAYYADAVAWAVEQGITAGTSATTFSPDASCTRGQMVTFLWRASGSPAPRGSANPFTDVQLGAYYYDAVLWAAEQGITSGTSATAFSPNAIVSRGQAVTFLYRAAGSPAAVGSTSFGDVASGAYYTDAVQWAVSRGVTVGTRGTTFSPDSDCSRAQIATFLYRDRVN